MSFSLSRYYMDFAHQPFKFTLVVCCFTAVTEKIIAVSFASAGLWSVDYLFLTNHTIKKQDPQLSNRKERTIRRMLTWIFSTAQSRKNPTEALIGIVQILNWRSIILNITKRIVGDQTEYFQKSEKSQRTAVLTDMYAVCLTHEGIIKYCKDEEKRKVKKPNRHKKYRKGRGEDEK